MYDDSFVPGKQSLHTSGHKEEVKPPEIAFGEQAGHEVRLFANFGEQIRLLIRRNFLREVRQQFCLYLVLSLSDFGSGIRIHSL